MKTILSFLFLVFSVTGSFAQQCHEFIIRTESIASNFSGGGGCGFMPFRDDKDKDSVYKPLLRKPIYIALYAPYNFDSMAVGSRESSILFSEKINDTLMAFTKTDGQDISGMVFSGEYREKGKLKKLRVRLARCKTSVDAESNEIFYVCRKCLEPELKEKRKGIFAWVGRIFS